MVKQINIERFFDLTETIPVIDVRSPKEFEHAHIPGRNKPSAIFK
jgi:tRNA 2-selenouridine synthase